MTEKELRKLKRSDFLQLLLAQSKEMEAVQARLDETTEELMQLRANNEHLNAQNELIEQLKGTLDSKDETINALRQELEGMKQSRPGRSIRSKKTVSAANKSTRPNGMQKVGKKALEQRLHQIRTKRDELLSKCKAVKTARSEKAEQKRASNAPENCACAPAQKPRLVDKLRRRNGR